MVFNQSVSFLFNTSRYDPVKFICFNDLLDQIWCVLNIPLNGWSSSDVLKANSLLASTNTIISFVKFSKSLLNKWNPKLLRVTWCSMSNQPILIKRYIIINYDSYWNPHQIEINAISPVWIILLSMEQSFDSFRVFSNSW